MIYDLRSHCETITVVNKVYPEWSDHHGYIVCVGGINDNGEWRRLYPIPYDNWWNPKNKHLAFKKWDKIKLWIVKQAPNKDPRKESHKLVDPTRIEIVDHIGTTKSGWEERRALIDRFVSPGMKTLNDSRYKDRRRGGWTSMGVIKPREVLDFEQTDRLSVVDDEGAEQVMGVQMRALAGKGVAPPSSPDPINRKIGYRFKCAELECFTCNHKKNSGHYIMCTDWEVGQLYRKAGFEKTREKMMDIANNRDLYLMMGTVAQKFGTFINVGIFYPPKIDETSMAPTLMPYSLAAMRVYAGPNSNALFPCVVCKAPVSIKKTSIRWYHAAAMRNPKYNKIKGLCCSKCFNKDYDDFVRPRTRTKSEISNRYVQRTLM